MKISVKLFALTLLSICLGACAPVLFQSNSSGQKKSDRGSSSTPTEQDPAAPADPVQPGDPIPPGNPEVPDPPAPLTISELPFYKSVGPDLVTTLGLAGGMLTAQFQLKDPDNTCEYSTYLDYSLFFGDSDTNTLNVTDYSDLPDRCLGLYEGQDIQQNIGGQCQPEIRLLSSEEITELKVEQELQVRLLLQGVLGSLVGLRADLFVGTEGYLTVEPNCTCSYKFTTDLRGYSADITSQFFAPAEFCDDF